MCGQLLQFDLLLDSDLGLDLARLSSHLGFGLADQRLHVGIHTLQFL